MGNKKEMLIGVGGRMKVLNKYIPYSRGFDALFLQR